MTIKPGTYVITGGAQGLGKAAALRLAAEGVHLALVDRQQAPLNQTVEACRRQGAEAKGYLANVADEQQVEDLFSAAEDALGPISGLLNNAGILRDGLLVKTKRGRVIERLSLQQWQAVMDVNLTGVFLCGRAAATKMIESASQGVIINISSVSRAGNIGQTNYAATKAGVAALTVSWARELSRYGIRCAGIAPGVFETEMVAAMKPADSARLLAAIPAGRAGRLDEFADTVHYILANNYVNARMIEVDGGLRL